MSTINCNSLQLNEGSSRTDTKERMSSLKTLPSRSTPRTGPRFDITHGGLFDESAAAYDHHRPAYPDVVIQEMIDLSNLRPGSRLLDRPLDRRGGSGRGCLEAVSKPVAKL